jgi:cytochrome c oxidase subunit II
MTSCQRLGGLLAAAFALALGLTAGAGADEVVGAPGNAWNGIGFQPAGTALADEMHRFHNHVLLPIIVAITVFVFGLLLWVILRYNARRNPVPTQSTHNTLLEILWTAVPVLILVVIAVPSFRLLYDELVIPKPDLTIKAIGKQWYWTYEYPDNGNFTFDAVMVQDADLKPGQLRLLETDNEVVLPVGKVIRIQITAADVIHAWAMQSFNVKHDAIPGRVNESWFNIEKPGLYYGQCSELCGTGHAYMPIKVRAVSLPEYESWVREAQAKFARVDGAPPAAQVAAAGQ